MQKLSECIYATQYPGLNLIFAGKYPPNPVELLNGKYFAALITETRKVYDYVLIDTPPLRALLMRPWWPPNCDGSIIVIGDGNVRYRQAQEVKVQLEKAGSNTACMNIFLEALTKQFPDDIILLHFCYS